MRPTSVLADADNTRHDGVLEVECELRNDFRSCRDEPGESLADMNRCP